MSYLFKNRKTALKTVLTAALIVQTVVLYVKIVPLFSSRHCSHTLDAYHFDIFSCSFPQLTFMTYPRIGDICMITGGNTAWTLTDHHNRSPEPIVKQFCNDHVFKNNKNKTLIVIVKPNNYYKDHHDISFSITYIIASIIIVLNSCP